MKLVLRAPCPLRNIKCRSSNILGTIERNATLLPG